MDTKIEIKEEDLLSDDGISQNETVFFTKDVTMKTNSEAVLLGNDCNVTFKAETTFPDSCFQIKSETIASSNMDIKTEIEEQTLVSDFDSQNKSKLPPGAPDMTVKNYDSDNEIEIKAEPWWVETGISSVCDDNKDGNFYTEKTSRTYKPVSGARFL